MAGDRTKYDTPEFRAARKAWGQRIRNGERPQCTRCPHPVEPGDKWHLDHYDDGNPDALAPAHARCNTAAGGKKAQRLARLRRTGPKRPRSQNW